MARVHAAKFCSSLGIWTGVITPYMLNSTAWNWG